MVAQVEIDGTFPGQISTWADRARAWRRTKKKGEPSEEENAGEVSDLAGVPNPEERPMVGEGSALADPVMVD